MTEFNLLGTSLLTDLYQEVDQVLPLTDLYQEVDQVLPLTDLYQEVGPLEFSYLDTLDIGLAHNCMNMNLMSKR